MAEERLSARDVRNEQLRLQRVAASRSGALRTIEWLGELQDCARQIQGGYVKKIVWDKESGCPSDSWGYTQYTVRPFVQGYGGDGTTADNAHLVAISICERLGIDYARNLRQARSGEMSIRDAKRWVKKLRANTAVAEETVIPDKITDDVVVLMLSDLYENNNQLLTAILLRALHREGWKVTNVARRASEIKTRANEASEANAVR